METMNAPTAKPAAKGKSSNLADELRTEPGIPLHEVRFRQNPPPDFALVSKSSSMVIRADERIELAYLPRLQLYRLIEGAREKGAKDRVVYFPREWASWEPKE